MTTTTKGSETTDRTGAETELRAAARRGGLTMRELAAELGVTPGYLSMLGSGQRKWTAEMREKAAALLGEAPGQGVVYRQKEVVAGESTFIRERARAMGMSMKDLAERVGVTPGYLTSVSRGRRRMGVKVRARVEATLEVEAKVAPATRACVDQRAIWSRMDAHGISQNEAARQAGISSAHLSNIMSGKATPSSGVLKKLHGVLFRPTKEERVVPAEVKVLAWKKGERHGLVVRGTGGPGSHRDDDAIRIGGRVPWGAKVKYAYRSGYDSRGWVSVSPVVTQGLSCMLAEAETSAT